MCCMINIQKILSIIVNSDKFRHTHVYSDIFGHTVGYLKPCVTLAYSEPCLIQNPTGIFRTLRNAYWEPCHIWKFAIFRILAYLVPKSCSEFCLFRHIQASSIMIVTITLTFFFHFNLKCFSTKFKKAYVLGYNDVISMLDWVLINTWSLKMAL